MDTLDEDFEEIQRLSDEIDKDWELINTGVDWIFVLSDLKSHLEQFMENMTSLKVMIDIIPEQPDSYFIKGIIWIGIISAYEGFVHKFFDSLFDNERFAQQAHSKINTLKREDRRHLRIIKNKDITHNEIKEKFRNATLNYPSQAARLFNQLFGLKIPEIPDKKMKNILTIRKEFAHNNGMVDGNKIDIPLKSLTALYYFIDNIVAIFCEKFNYDANEKFKNMEI